jgi:hypothetical protein
MLMPFYSTPITSTTNCAPLFSLCSDTDVPCLHPSALPKTLASFAVNSECYTRISNPGKSESQPTLGHCSSGLPISESPRLPRTSVPHTTFQSPPCVPLRYSLSTKKTCWHCTWKANEFGPNGIGVLKFPTVKPNLSRVTQAASAPGEARTQEHTKTTQ